MSSIPIEIITLDTSRAAATTGGGGDGDGGEGVNKTGCATDSGGCDICETSKGAWVNPGR